MIIKQQWNTTTHQLEWQKSRKLMALKAGEDVKQHKLSFFCENEKKQKTKNTVWPGWKTICWFLTKLNILLLYNWVILLLDIYPKELKTCVHNLQMDADSSFIHNCWNMEAAKMPFRRWMDKLWYIQTVQYYSVQKTNYLSTNKKTWKKPKWASLMAQMVKNPLAMRETLVWSLGWEDPLEEGMANHSSILAWKMPMDRAAWQALAHGVAKSQT